MPLPNSFAPFPRSAAWQHQGVRDGFEVAFFRQTTRGIEIETLISAVEQGEPWSVRAFLLLNPDWKTRAARVREYSNSGQRELSIEGDGLGHWLIDGSSQPALDGCLDVDLESSALTNAMPVHRLSLTVGDSAEAPAVYVRLGLGVARLEQHYRRLDDYDSGQRFDYESPAFDFRCVLRYDLSGLVVSYPGIATRVF